MQTRSRIPDDPLAPTVEEPKASMSPTGNATTSGGDDPKPTSRPVGPAPVKIVAEDPPVRTTVVIPRSLHRQLKTEAHRRFLDGKPTNVSELMAEAARIHLDAIAG